MAINKSEYFTEQEQKIAAFSKILSHPARVAILKMLIEKNECVCGEIVELLPLAQSTVSQHLKELKNAGLIKGKIDGPKSCYCINWETFESISKDFELFFTKLKEKSCC